MGFWLAQLKLETGETIRWKSAAGRVLSRWITSGGQLVATDRRVFFQPNRFDSLIGRKPWECPLDAVTGIEDLAREGVTLTEGTRKRLEIQTKHGSETFIVNKLKEKVPKLRELLRL
jgi:hypothetical protein